MMAAGWRLPSRPLRDGAIRALTLGAAFVVFLATVARPWLAAGPSYPSKAVAIFAVLMLIAIGQLQQHHPFPRFGAANQVTSLRAAFVAMIAGLLGETLSAHAMVAVAASGLVVAGLDGLDGQIARRRRMASAFGARFDMETDACFIMVLSALVWRAGKAGPWILLAGLMRYLFVGAMTLFPWMRKQEPPSYRRKAICVMQVLGLSLVMLPMITPTVSIWWCAVVLLTLCYSFGVDILWLWRHRD